MSNSFDILWKNFLTANIKVEEILKKYAVTRDNDSLLVATYHKLEIGTEKFETLSAREYLTKIINGELITADTITRGRRKIQELNPELRGKTYIERQKNSIEVRNRINN